MRKYLELIEKQEKKINRQSLLTNKELEFFSVCFQCFFYTESILCI